MKISVVTATYNCKKTIERTIISVLRQTYTNIEYLIIDGLSSDGTIDVIKEYAQNDGRIRVLIERDKGIYDAMNKAVAMATGEYVYFLGGDDVLFSENTLQQVADRITNFSDIVYGDIILYPSGNRMRQRQTTKSIITFNICHQAIFYPTKYLKARPYDLRYKIWADHELNLFCWGKYGAFKYIEIPIAQYNQTGFSSFTEDEVFKKDRLTIVKKHLGLFGMYYWATRTIMWPIKKIFS